MSIAQNSWESTSPYIRVPALYSLAAGLRRTPSVRRLDDRLGRVTMTDIHLDDAGRMGQQQLDLAVLKDPPEPELDGQRTHLVPGVIQQPGAALPLQEGAAIVGADDLLAEMGRLDGRVADDAGALPASDQPREGRQRWWQVDVEFEGHVSASCFPGRRRRFPPADRSLSPCRRNRVTRDEHVHVSAYMGRPNPELLVQNLGVHHGLPHE